MTEHSELDAMLEEFKKDISDFVRANLLLFQPAPPPDSRAPAIYTAFGPQGEQVCDLLARIAAISANEARSLARSAVGEAWTVAWGTARLEGHERPLDLVWGAAKEGTECAARPADWPAGGKVGGAAIGLLVRDLISTADYDALTLPVRRVLGRIHPDDPEVAPVVICESCNLTKPCDCEE